MKRAKNTIDGMNPKAWMEYMFDHTVVIAEDDPWLEAFRQMDTAGVAQIRVVPSVGAEKFSEYIFNKVNDFVQVETDGRVRVTRVEFREHDKNTASYGE
jgi:6-pyruvoyltetrahydropterin/6-carboxytetrahydropterin synthase